MAGANVARPHTPIDLETVRRNLREVMTNLRLLENGENIEVEDLIRQAQENLNRNRRFILHNIGRNRGNPIVRNDNRVLAVHLERLPNVLVQQQMEAIGEGGQRPRVRDHANNVGGQINGNGAGNDIQNLPGNGGNDRVGRIANQARERYQRNWENLDRNEILRYRRRVIRDLRNRANEINNGNPAINRGYNDNGGAQGRPVLRPHMAPHFDINVRPRYQVHQANAGPPRLAQIFVGGANPAPARPDNFAYVGLGIPAIAANRVPYVRPAAPVARDVVGLEERIALLQERLDRIEDGRFYDVMIEGGGQHRMINMIRALRQRIQRERAANIPANRNTGAVDNAPIVELNHDRPPIALPPAPPTAPNQAINQERPPIALPPAPPTAPNQAINQERPPIALPPAPPTAPNQAINQENRPTNLTNQAAKRPADSLTGNTNDDQVRPAKQPKVEGTVPGRSTDEVPPRPNETVAGPSSNLRDASDAEEGSRQNTVERISTISKYYKSKEEKKRDNDKDRPKISPDDLRDAGPSRSRSERDNIDRNNERNNIENRAQDPDAPINIEQEVEFIPPDVENQENAQQDENDDVIIVDADLPVRIKIERNDDDDAYNAARNNLPNQAAQNRANPPAIPQILNGRYDVQIRQGLDIPIPMAPPPQVPGAAPRFLREHGGQPARPWPQIFNYIRRALARGQDFPRLLEPPFLNRENIVAGLQNLLTIEERNFRRANGLPGLVNDNHREAEQLETVRNYMRIRRELREVVSNTERLGILSHTVCVNAQGHIVLVVKLLAPPGSFYNGAEIGIRITLGTEQLRPFTHVRMSHRFWHPNICPFTRLILPHYPWHTWTIFKMLACVRRLLIIPELENVTHYAIADQYRNHREIFRRTAQHWTSVYCYNNENDHLAVPEYTELLERLVEEGIPKDRALHLLSKNNWDIDRAMEEIS